MDTRCVILMIMDSACVEHVGAHGELDKVGLGWGESRGREESFRFAHLCITPNQENNYDRDRDRGGLIYFRHLISLYLILQNLRPHEKCRAHAAITSSGISILMSINTARVLSSCGNSGNSIRQLDLRIAPEHIRQQRRSFCS